MTHTPLLGLGFYLTHIKESEVDDLSSHLLSSKSWIGRPRGRSRVATSLICTAPQYAVCHKTPKPTLPRRNRLTQATGPGSSLGTNAVCRFGATRRRVNPPFINTSTKNIVEEVQPAGAVGTTTLNTRSAPCPHVELVRFHVSTSAAPYLHRRLSTSPETAPAR